jgi:hypothetical protein
MISLLGTFLFGMNEKNIYSYLLKNQEIFNISPNVLMGIIKTESNCNEYAINVNSKYKFKKNVYFTFKYYLPKNVKIKMNGKYIAIYPNTKREAILAYKILKFLEKKHLINTYDLGLMQINKINLKNKNELEYLLNYKQNIKLGANILYQCFLKFKNTDKGNIKTFECYNKGYNNEKFNAEYFKRFFTNFSYVCKHFKRKYD